MSRINLVLIPALGSDARLWEPVIEQLPDTVQPIVVQGRGNSIQAMAEDILDQIPAEPFLLAGISMGSYISLDIAIKHPDRLKGLALLNSSAIAAPENRKSNSFKLIEMVEEGHFDNAVSLISSSVSQDPITSNLAKQMARDLGPEIFVDQQLAVAYRKDRSAELHHISVPTLILAGSTDVITPVELSHHMAAGIENSTLEILQDVGHLSTVEDTAGVVSALTHWITNVSHQLQRSDN